VVKALPITSQDSSKTRARIVCGGGGSEGMMTAGTLTRLSEHLSDCNVAITGIDGTSAGAITASLFVSGYNDGGVVEATRRLNAFWNDMKSQGWHHTLARNNALFWFLTPNQRSRLWTKQLMLTHEFMRGSGMHPPVQQTLESLLKKHIPHIESLHQGPMDITINTMTTNKHNGEQEHHIHPAHSISYDTIIAATALAQLGPRVLNGVHHFDGGHAKNGYLEAALADKNATDIFVLSTYPIGHPHQSDARHGEPVKQGELHYDAYHAHMAHPDIHLHSISTMRPAADPTDRMCVDPARMNERYAYGVSLANRWINLYGDYLGVRTSYEFTDDIRAWVHERDHALKVA
jgi:predicted acylesterase/phospholipase RssA